MTAERPRTLRLFVAIELPANVLDALNRVQHNLQRDPALARLRWTRPEGIHLTLKFLGETPAARQKDIESAVGRAAHGIQPFDLHLGKLGKFGTRQNPRVLWIDVEGETEPLGRLQSQTERELAKLRYPPENRKFSPHLTLARIPPERAREVADALDQALAATEAPTATFSVDELSLMRSELKPGGAVYTRLFAAPIR
jgi:RNA 2',3'-cyclic 3'-phosphodiesterase